MTRCFLPKVISYANLSNCGLVYFYTVSFQGCLLSYLLSRDNLLVCFLHRLVVCPCLWQVILGAFISHLALNVFCFLYFSIEGFKIIFSFTHT